MKQKKIRWNKESQNKDKGPRNQERSQEPLAWVGPEPERLVAGRPLQSNLNQGVQKKEKKKKKKHLRAEASLVRAEESVLFNPESGMQKRLKKRKKGGTQERQRLAVLKSLVITRSCCGKQYGIRQAGIGFLLGMPVGFLIGYILFQRFSLELVLLILGGLVGARAYPLFLMEKREQVFRLQFCDYLDSISMSLACGRNTYDTFLSASADMRTLYAEEAPICLAGEYIAGNLMAGERLSTLLETVAKESNCEDVQTFGNVYLICEQAGGNLKQVVDQSRNMLTEKISIEAEISVLLAGPKNELYLMTGMPLLILTAMKLLSTDLFTAEHLAINLVALILFIFAFLLGRNMVKIRV